MNPPSRSGPYPSTMASASTASGVAANAATASSGADTDSELVRRMQSRDPHYMKLEMVDSQLAIYGEPSVDEVDVLPVNAEEGVKGVIEQIEDLIKLVGL